MTDPTGCAHLKVEYRPREANGRMFARWVCEGCWEPFAPTPTSTYQPWGHHERLDHLLAMLDSLRQQLNATCLQRDALQVDLRRVREALDASVTLQSHYAALLNTWDGGRRILFKDAADLLARLAMTAEERMRDPRTRDERSES